MKFSLNIFLSLSLLSFTQWAHAAEPGKDHPLVGRYEGSKLAGYKAAAYDEVGVIKEPFENWGGGKPDLLRLEGKVTQYCYQLPAERSSLEVLRNYESSLKSKGFEILFSCSTSNGSCYKPRPERGISVEPMSFALAFDEPERPRLGECGGFVRNSFGINARYLLARHSSPNGATYASIALGEDSHTGNRAHVTVVESKAMDKDKIIFVDAATMQKSLNDKGRISLYGILFDLDKDIVKPESQPTIDEMNKLLRSNPQLRLQVVGHTDAQGEARHNDDLSKRRAVAVIRALVNAGVDPRRFTTRGAGAAEPLAPNDNEAGRAKNRRVELVRL